MNHRLTVVDASQQVTVSQTKDELSLFFLVSSGSLTDSAGVQCSVIGPLLSAHMTHPGRDWGSIISEPGL